MAVRWRLMASDLRSLFGRLPRLFRNDLTAVMLVFANIFPVFDLLSKGDPIGVILVIYWMQLMIIGFWNAVKLIVIARWKAFLYVPLFVLMYLSIINMFGLIAGILLDDQMRGTAWHQDFSLWDYWVPAALFFANHGLSFWVNFIRGREFEDISSDTQMGKPFLRAMPMWAAAIPTAFVGGFFNSAASAVLFVLPVKLALDVFGHFYEHGMLSFDDNQPTEYGSNRKQCGT